MSEMHVNVGENRLFREEQNKVATQSMESEGGMSLKYNQSMTAEERENGECPTPLRHSRSIGAIEDPVEADEKCACYRLWLRWPPLYRCLSRWPRLSSLLLGVMFPMLVLILFCMACGLWVSHYEAPQEVADNNARLANYTKSQKLAQSIFDITTILPELCLEMYLNNETTKEQAIERILNEIALFQGNVTDNPEENILKEVSGESQSNHIDNATELKKWMFNCTSFMQPTLVTMFKKFGQVAFTSESQLTFNWIRCVPGADGLGHFNWIGAPNNISQMRYAAQSEHFTQAWNTDQQNLFEQYQQELTNNRNDSRSQAKVMALVFSIDDASGYSACEYNAPAAGFFWFAVLSTIGYGNMAPETDAGRCIVFTLGFFSILAFGGILATAGEITNAVADDLLRRLRLQWMTRPLIACITWGGLYYSWMVLTAFVTMRWKLSRLGEAPSEFKFSDAFWFSYISSTTIGFGDIYLEPEVLLAQDLLTFPILLLVSFIFVSAFLGKFSECFGALCGKKTLVGDLTEQLNRTQLYIPDTVGAQIDNGLGQAGINVVQRMKQARSGMKRGALFPRTAKNSEAGRPKIDSSQKEGKVPDALASLGESNSSSLYFDAPHISDIQS